jgi:hypothetical protein
MQASCSRLDRGFVSAVDVRLRLDREGDVVQPRRVELERLRRFGTRCLTQANRSRTGNREAQVVDRLAPLARKHHGGLDPEWAEYGSVERQRPLEVPADEIDMTEADEHGTWSEHAADRLLEALHVAAHRLLRTLAVAVADRRQHFAVLAHGLVEAFHPLEREEPDPQREHVVLV